MSKVTFHEDACKGCGLCTAACPRGIVIIDESKINSKGYSPAVCIDMDRCIGCAFCAKMCPDCVIDVEK